MANATVTKKVVLCALNAKYIHSSLSLRYLQAYCRQYNNCQIDIREFTINQSASETMAEIFLLQPDILAFSCYIWNINKICEICADYKKVAPSTHIILGGPEVSYDSVEVLQDRPYIDCIVRGEGELSFNELITVLLESAPLHDVAGITYRDGAEIHHNQDRDLIINLDQIPFPYQGCMDSLADRTVYYESSRGCPFNCSYCLSSTIKGVRYFSLPRVKRDLQILLQQQVREIKFVDRTFNSDEKRAREIMEFIVANRGRAQVHLEIDAGIISDSLMDYLAGVPHGIFNFEIGIQSTFKPALDAVRRRHDWERSSYNIQKLRSFANIHLHLDLIAGLPHETYQDFSRTFNMVFSLQPDYLQLGFLKLLKGSDLRRESWRNNYSFQTQPPYQILSHNHLEYHEVLALTRIEELLDRYYNSGHMCKTMNYIRKEIYTDNPIGFFKEFADYWLNKRLFGLGHKNEALYTYLLSFIRERHALHFFTCHELMKYDYLCKNHKYTLPEGLISHNPDNVNDLIYSYTRNQEFIANYIPEYIGLSPREIKKQLHLEYFHLDPRSMNKVSQSTAVLFSYDAHTKTAARIIYLDEIQ